MPGHAKFSPSSMHRRLACIGSLAMEDGFPDSSSVYAAEGTAAHFLAAECLESNRDAKELIGENIYVADHASWTPISDGDSVFAVGDAMAAYVQIYLDNIRQYATGCEFFVEVSLPIGHITTEENAAGTGDAIVFEIGGEEIQVHDLKYGFTKVRAKRNTQLMTYALGALEAFTDYGNFKRARLVIHQPRVDETPDEWVVDVDNCEADIDLKRFYETVNKRAKDAFIALEFKDNWFGKDTAYLSPAPPGEDDYCRYCKAQAICQARAQAVADAVCVGFDEIVEQELEYEIATPVDLTSAMKAIPFIENWCTAVRAEVERRLFAGEEVSEYKIVQGKKGNRAWGNAEEVEEAMKSMRIKKDDMYDFRVISPASAEKKAKAGIIKEGHWKKLQALITQAEGRPSVAHVSDKRPAVEIKPAAEGFEQIEEGSDLI